MTRPTHRLKLEMVVNEKTLKDILFSWQGSITAYTAERLEPEVSVTNPGEALPVVEPLRPVGVFTVATGSCPVCEKTMLSGDVCQNCGYGSRCFQADECVGDASCPFGASCPRGLHG